MERGKGSAMNWDPTLLMVELNQGHELTRRLETQLLDPHQQCPEEIRALVHGIMASWKKAMSVAAATPSSQMMMGQRPAGALAIDTSMGAAGGPESPRSASHSPPSGGSDVPFSDQESRDVCKKRKSGQAKWTQQVQVSPAAGSSLESPIEDGHSWRKYGQKDILGARYPRAYYRCTHRHTQGCQATKHVQRTDENPTVFDVTYKGKHTCFPRQQQQQDSTPPPPAPHDGMATAKARASTLLTHTAASTSGLHNVFMSFGTGGLTVKTEETTADASASSPFSAFSFPPTPLSCPGRPETNIFSCSSSSPAFPPACSSGGGLSPPFLSPATSESNYFSMSPGPVSTAGVYGMGAVGGTGGSMHSELAEIVSAATSTTSSPLVDLDFSPADLDAALLDSSFFSWAK